MSNSRKLKRARGARRQNNRLRVAAGRSTGRSPHDGRPHAVRSRTVTPAGRQEMPPIPAAAAKSIYVVIVSLYGAAPPPWRRLELHGAMTLDRIHEVLQETFGWSDFGPHSFLTVYGEFGGPVRPGSGAARRAGERCDESGITLAQATCGEGLGMAYLYGYKDEWRVDILVEKILAAVPGVAYPRCTGGQGEDVPGEGFLDVREFNAERDPFGWDTDVDPEELTEDLADLATVIIPDSVAGDSGGRA
jgi:Plasmid pRiA4b ORF-3-like protein